MRASAQLRPFHEVFSGGQAQSPSSMRIIPPEQVRGSGSRFGGATFTVWHDEAAVLSVSASVLPLLLLGAPASPREAPADTMAQLVNVSTPCGMRTVIL